MNYLISRIQLKSKPHKVKDLEQKGMPSDEAQIALLIRLRAVVEPEILQVAEMLSDDPEVYSAINDDKNADVESVAR